MIFDYAEPSLTAKNTPLLSAQKEKCTEKRNAK